MEWKSAVFGLITACLLPACTDQKTDDHTLGGAKISSAAAIDRAVTLGEDKRKMSEQMRKHGLDCSIFLETEKCATFFVRRVLPNTDLVAALLYARSRDVLVIAAEYFSVNQGVVAVDIRATDGEIVQFLCGESRCPNTKER